MNLVVVGKVLLNRDMISRITGPVAGSISTFLCRVWPPSRLAVEGFRAVTALCGPRPDQLVQYIVPLLIKATKAETKMAANARASVHFEMGHH